ncbi:PHD finger protein 7-like [Anomalospiza imberbis]|uniref:PHD finger protein 7-like n=1 Tax=Anomalospiza imberbis TaxID=187417 RepID=UPI00358EA587
MVAQFWLHDADVSLAIVTRATKASKEREDQHLEETVAFLDRDSALRAAMTYSKQEGPGAREPACMLCRRAEADPDMCGDKLEKYGLCAHVFCLALPGAVGLPGEAPRLLLMGLLGSFQRCCVCGQSGATIMCCQEDCGRWFHLPCAKEGGCVTQYIPEYSTYCPEHRPEQDVEATAEPGTDCPICMEPVEDRKTFRTLVCPACKRAWFHRDCIQGQAMRAGLLCLHCPLCRDIKEFLAHMFIMGIRIPFREPTWEDNDAFADLGERHSRCNARDCLYPGGREEAEEEGPWELLLCSSCAAEGTHRLCSGLRNRIESWECDSCAGLGTGMRQSSRCPWAGDSAQAGLGRAPLLLKGWGFCSGLACLAPGDQRPQKPPTHSMAAVSDVFLTGHQQPQHIKFNESPGQEPQDNIKR